MLSQPPAGSSKCQHAPFSGLIPASNELRAPAIDGHLAQGQVQKNLSSLFAAGEAHEEPDAPISA